MCSVLLTRKTCIPYPNPSSYMTRLVAGSEAFELSSKAGRPVTLSPLVGRVPKLYNTAGDLLVSSLSPSLFYAPLGTRLWGGSSSRSHSSRRSASPDRGAAAAKAQNLDTLAAPALLKNEEERMANVL